jgi:hypothetical protein
MGRSPYNKLINVNYEPVIQNTYNKSPEKVEVNEYRAPTDDSIRLAEEMHEKVLNKLISSVKVENNLINGEAFALQEPGFEPIVRMVFKFKINGKEFTAERRVSRDQLYDVDTDKYIAAINNTLDRYAKAIMLWYALTELRTSLFEQITGQQVPDYINNK